ncbi:MAG: putative transporter proteinprobable glutamate/aspartate transrane subunit [Pseudomonadota bacterium]|jgi:glutamate/aspartate transport system permease protein
MSLDFNVITDNTSYLLQGLRYSAQVTLVAMFGGIFLGTILAMMRLSSSKVLSSIATLYINTFRSIPLVLVLLIFFLFMPKITGIPIGADQSAYITFTIFEAAYYAEIMRAGIQSVSKGQTFAGYAMGLTYGQTMQHIILPQAFRNVLPILLTQTIILFQDISLVYAIGATDFLGAADKLNQRDFKPVELYLFVAVVYFILCFGLSKLVKSLQNKIAIIR